MKTVLQNSIRSLRDFNSTTRVFGLDLLRAIAILLVIYAHGAFLLPPHIAKLVCAIVIVEPVTLFFVLSGFLIGRILFDTLEKEQLTLSTIFRFWLRRWMRTLPAYFATMILLVAVYQKFDLLLILRYSFFVQNFSWPHPEWFGEAWSLSVEEWFYLLIPALLFTMIAVFKQSRQKAFLVVCISFIVLMPLYRWYKYETLAFVDLNAWDLLFRKQVSTRMDSLMYGVLGAYLFHFKKAYCLDNEKRWFSLGLVLIFFTWFYNYFLANFGGFYKNVLSFSIEPFAVLLIVPFFAGIRLGSGKVARVLTVISKISYSLYLLNLSFSLMKVCNIVPNFDLTGLGLYTYKIGIYIFTTFFSATILYVTVEHPFMVLRDRITKGWFGETKIVAIDQPS